MRKFILPTLCLGLALLGHDARAANQFWDNNGTGAATSGTWDTTSTKWATSSVLTASTSAFVNGNFPEFAAGSGTTAAMTITVNSAVSCAGMADGLSGATVTSLTFSGSGSISIASGLQGFFCGPSSSDLVLFNVPLTGPGGLQQHSSGAIALVQSNSYSGGTAVTGGQVLYYYTNASFGTGAISIGATGNAFVNNTSPAAALTITNAWTFPTAGFEVNLAGGNPVSGNPGTTFTGPFTLPATGTINLETSSTATQVDSITGAISGASGLQISDAGTMILAGANTYTGPTSIGGFSGTTTVSVSSLNKVTGGSTSSSLGAPTASVNGTIAIGTTTFGGKLTYTGAGETTDRVINLAGTTGPVTIEQDGAGAVTFSSAMTATGAGIKTLTLQGSSTAANTIGGAIVNNSGVNTTALTKAQAGTWVLTAANSYTGATTVSGGTLDLGSGGSIGASAVTVASGATLGSTTTSATSIGGNTTFSSGGKAAFTATGGVSTSVGKIDVTGTLAFNSTVITINVSGSPLAAGSYRLMDCTGAESGTPNATPTIAGTALATGYTASISTTTGTGGHIDLVVKATPLFSGLSSQTITYGGTSITLNGTLSNTTGPANVYPANGDVVSAKINNHTVNGTVTDNIGDFSITYNDPSLATDGVSGSPYTVTYSYLGNAGIFVNAAANDTSTHLTVNPAALTITANNQSKTYGQTVTTSGSSQFTTSPLQNGETVTSVTLSIGGGGATATASVAGSPYTITPGAPYTGTFTPGNYTITPASGSLTVNPLAVVLSGNRSVNGSTDAAAGILSVANKVGGDTVEVGLGDGTLAGSGLGSQAITSFGTLALGNAGGNGNANGTGSAASFNLPSGEALDSSGNLYIADTANNAIREITVPGGVVTTLAITGLKNPVGVAVDAAGDVFVADTGNNQIVELPFGGGQTTLGFTGLSSPAGVAVDSTGNVFVADTGNNQILELAPPYTGTQTVLGFTGLDDPSGVALDSSANVYVSDTDNNQVLELAPPYTGTQTTVGFTGLAFPYGVAVDATGDVFVADMGNNRVLRYDGVSQSVESLTGLNPNGPYGVAVDAAGDVFVTDSANNQIEELPFGGGQTTLAGSAVAANYTMTGASGSVTITEAASFSALSSETITYGAATVTLTGTVSGAGPVYPADGETVTVTINGVPHSTVTSGGLGGFSINYPTASLGVSGSPYPVTYSYGGDSSLNPTSDSTTTLTVDPLSVVLTGTRLYDGTATASFSILSIVNKVGSDNVTLASGSATLAAATAGVEPIISAGTLTLGGTAAANYTLASASGTVTINDANTSFSGLTASQSANYGSTVTLSGTVSAPGPLYPAIGETINVTIDGNTQPTMITTGTGGFTINFNTAGIPASVTPYPITYAYGGDISLNPASDSTTTLTVNQLPVVLSGSRPYDGTTAAAAAILSVANKVGSDDVSVASGSGTLAGANVGLQNIVSFGTLALGGTTAPNYTLVSASGSVNIGQAALTITANNQSKTYGQTVTFGSGSTLFTTSPLQNGETVTSVTLTCGGGAANASVTGSPYTITPGAPYTGTFNPANYNISPAAGSLTVNPLAVVLTGSRNYDGTATAAAAILTVANKVGSDDVTVASGSATLAAANAGPEAIISAGTLALGGTTAPDYTLVSASGTVTINPGLTYWDPSGTTVTATPNGNWEDVAWAPTSALTSSLISWPENNAAAFAAGTGATGTYTVTASANHTIAGMFNGGLGDSAGNVVITGPGILSVYPGLQGFYSAGGASGNTSINTELTGSGGIETQGGGSLFLYASNSYSGGTVLDTSAGLNFNNDHSFGTGIITWGTGTTVLATPASDGFGNTGATGPITITNPVVTISGVQIFVGLAAAPVTFAGPWTNPATGTVEFENLPAGTTVGISGIIYGGAAFNKAGGGTLVLSGANAYTGATSVTGGTLALGAGGSIGASATTVSTSATLANFATSTGNIGAATILSSGALAAFTATGGASTTIGAISVAGGLTLNNNAITVNVSGAPLAAGTYTLMSCTGTLSGSANATPTIAGTALAAGYTATVSTTAGAGGDVVLIVSATPVFSGLTSQMINYGTASVSLTGTLSSTAGPTTIYPANGDTVSASINGHQVNGTVTDNIGSFSINYNDPSLATDGVLGSPYPVTYAYGGNPGLSLTAASDASTTLTVNPASLTITANNQSKTYGQTVTFGSGSLLFMNSALQNGETITSVTLSCGGGAANAPVSGSPYTITPGAPYTGTFNPANYTITPVTGALTVSPLAVVLTGTRPFDATANAAAGILSVANKVGGDDVSVASGTGTLASQNLGLQNITSFGTLALGGTTAGNYTLTSASGSVNITGVTFSITSETIDPTGTIFTITWDSIPGAVYHVLGSTDASTAQSTWTDVSGPVTASGASTSFIINNTTPLTATLPNAVFSVKLIE